MLDVPDNQFLSFFFALEQPEGEIHHSAVLEDTVCTEAERRGRTD